MKTPAMKPLLNPFRFGIKHLFLVTFLTYAPFLFSQHRMVDTASYARMPEVDLKESSAFSSSEIFKLSVKSEDMKEFLGLVDLFEEVRQLKLVIDKSSIEMPDILNSISRMKSLEILTLDINSPGAVSPELGNLTALKALYITGKKISSLPDEIGNLENLEILGLEDLKITSLPATCSKLKHLKTLCIYNISSPDLSPFAGCGELTEIHLHNNNLTRLPELVPQLKNIQRFCSEGNPGVDYTQALTVLSQLSGLKFLQLKNDKLKSLPSGISELKSLSLLDLSSNDFNQIPPELYGLDKLTQLFIKDNGISMLPDEFAQLKKLTTLDLSGNKFTAFPSVLVRMPTLSSLSLNGNNLSDLGPDAGKMQQLRILSLLDTKKLDLVSALQSLSQLPNLTDLTLGGYSAPALPAEIGKLKNLKSLEISLGLKTLPSELFDIVTLEELYLNDNKLENVPEAIRNLKKLKILDLSGNSIHEFPKMLIKLPNLEDLVLADNGMISISDYGQEVGADHASGFKQLKFLDLSGNFKLSPDDIQNLISDLPVFQVCISDVHIEYRSEAERAYKLGSDKASRKEYAEASSAFTKAIQLNPLMAEAYAGRGQISYYQTHDDMDALEDFTKAIQLDSSRGDFFRFRADVEVSMNSFKSAVKDYTKAISLNGNDEASFANRASLKYRQLHDNKGSIEDYTKAIAINPKAGNYFTARGRVRFDQGEKNTACEDWKKAVELEDKDAADLLKKQCK